MLPCHIIRDLLPSYVEGLTSAETARAVEDHLDGCPDCRAVRNAMAAQMELDPAPQPRRDFLGEFKRHQHTSAILLVVLTFVFTYVFVMVLNWLVPLHALLSVSLLVLIPLVCGALISWGFRQRRKTMLGLFLLFLLLDAAAVLLEQGLRVLILSDAILGCTGMAIGLGIGCVLGFLERRRKGL